MSVITHSSTITIVLEQSKKKKRKKKKKIQKFQKSIGRKNKLSLLYLIWKFNVSFFSCPKIIKKFKPYLLYNIFVHNLICYIIISFCTQVAFAFDLQKHFYIVHDSIDTFFSFFFFRKILIHFTCLFSLFVFFLQKDFDNFHVPLFKAFLCFFDNV